MIETAFVSGQLGQAIYRVADELFALRADGTHRPASSAEIQEIASSWAEYRLVNAQTTEALQAELRKLVRHYNTLFLAISLLDYSISLPFA